MAKYCVKYRWRGRGDEFYTNSEGLGEIREDMHKLNTPEAAAVFAEFVRKVQIKHADRDDVWVVKLVPKKPTFILPKHNGLANVWHGVFIPTCNHPEVPLAIFMYADDANRFIERIYAYNHKPDFAVVRDIPCT